MPVFLECCCWWWCAVCPVDAAVVAAVDDAPAGGGVCRWSTRTVVGRTTTALLDGRPVAELAVVCAATVVVAVSLFPAAPLPPRGAGATAVGVAVVDCFMEEAGGACCWAGRMSSSCDGWAPAWGAGCCSEGVAKGRLKTVVGRPAMDAKSAGWCMVIFEVYATVAERSRLEARWLGPPLVVTAEPRGANGRGAEARPTLGSKTSKVGSRSASRSKDATRS